LNLYNAQISSRVAGMKIDAFRTVDAQSLLDGIAKGDKISVS